VARCQKADPTFPRVTAHALRHTAASLAISSGANPKVVQRMLGHASAAMTLDTYADLFESDLDSVAESVAKMWPRRGGFIMTLGTETMFISTYAAADCGPLVIPSVTSCLCNH
jgi:Phage integrase family